MSTEDAISAIRHLFGAADEKAQSLERLYASIGRVVVAASEVELYMSVLFITVSMPMGFEASAKHITELRSLDQKIKLVDYAFAVKASPEQQQEWQSIREELMRNKNVRNLVAHQGKTFLEGEGGVLEPILSPSPLEDKRGKLLKEADILAAADEMSVIKARIGALALGTFASYIYRDSDEMS